LRAEVIFTGTELLLGHTVNTNAPYLQQVLASLGIDLYYQVTVGDNRERLARAIDQARARADLVIVGGGLGPTEDDLSREALAQCTGVPLRLHERALEIVRRFFEERRLPMPENNLKQALVPENGVVLDNPLGTAPGVVLEQGDKTYILLPGPPPEFRLMVDSHVKPYLDAKLGSARKVISSRTIKLCGIGESAVDERLGDLFRGINPTVAPTARYAEVHLRITAKAGSLEEAGRMNAAVEEEIRRRLGEYVFGSDGETLADAVGKVFTRNKLTLVTVETFTAGLLAFRLATASGAGEFFRYGHVLGKERAAWPLTFAAGKKELAVQLASWGRSQTAADVCVAIAGEEKSQSEWAVYIATGTAGQIRSGEFKIPGQAADVRERAVQMALALLWRKTGLSGIQPGSGI
jgi:nicotinamide-nucleotide amidase